MWRVSSAANRPFPQVSDDDVLDFMVTEAVAVKVTAIDRKAEEERRRKEWRGKRDHLKKYQ